MRLERVDLDRQDAVEDLVQAGGDDRRARPRRAAGGADAALHPEDGQHDEGDADEHHRRPAPVDPDRHGEQRDQRDGVPPQRHQRA